MPRTKRTVPALTPAEALGMLASAITYLQQSGLTVKAGNDSRLGLVLAIDEARMVQDAFGVMRFEPGRVASIASTPAENASTPQPELPASAKDLSTLRRERGERQPQTA